MRMLIVTDSSNVAAIGFDDTAQALDVVFKSGKRYRYSHTTREDFAQLVSAQSLGERLHAQFVKLTQIHPCTRIHRDDENEPDGPLVAMALELGDEHARLERALLALQLIASSCPRFDDGGATPSRIAADALADIAAIKGSPR